MEESTTLVTRPSRRQASGAPLLEGGGVAVPRLADGRLELRDFLPVTPFKVVPSPLKLPLLLADPRDRILVFGFRPFKRLLGIVEPLPRWPRLRPRLRFRSGFGSLRWPLALLLSSLPCRTGAGFRVPTWRGPFVLRGRR